MCSTKEWGIESLMIDLYLVILIYYETKGCKHLQSGRMYTASKPLPNPYHPYHPFAGVAGLVLWYQGLFVERSEPFFEGKVVQSFRFG